MLLEIDNREKYLIEALKEREIVFEIVTLDVGDVRISHDNRTIVIIERKTISDLDQSIKDGRYRDQKYRMLDNYDRKQIMYIIEGFEYACYDRVKGAIINTLIRDDIKVFTLDAVGDTASFINDIAKRVEKEPEKYLSESGGGSSNIDNIKTMVKHTKNTYITKELFFNLTLCNIPSVSGNISKIIVEKYIDLKNMINTANIEDISNLKLASGKRIGSKVAERICMYIISS
jgi:ERCC4-type nuclease